MPSDITLHVTEDDTPITLKVVEAALKPEQEKTVTPQYDKPVVVLPNAGKVLSKVTVEPIPEPTTTETYTENGEYNVKRVGTAVVNVLPVLQDRSVTPSKQAQSVTAGQGYDGLGTVTVEPIPEQYVVPTGALDITANANNIDIIDKAEVNVNVPFGDMAVRNPTYNVEIGLKFGSDWHVYDAFTFATNTSMPNEWSIINPAGFVPSDVVLMKNGGDIGGTSVTHGFYNHGNITSDNDQNRFMVAGISLFSSSGYRAFVTSATSEYIFIRGGRTWCAGDYKIAIR